MPAFVLIGVVCAIAPIQFQKPPEPSWGKVFRWSADRRLAPARFAYFNLDANDICYFYLKTGVWLRDARKIDRTEASAPGLFLIVTTAKRDETMRQSTVFTAGNLAIVSGDALLNQK